MVQWLILVIQTAAIVRMTMISAYIAAFLVDVARISSMSCILCGQPEGTRCGWDVLGNTLRS
jgi:hypothetical protein